MARGRSSLPLLIGLVASAVAVALVALPLHQRASRTVLFDVDGPSPRDPPRSAWAKAGQGTAAWMERTHSSQALKAHAAHRGRKDRPFDRFVRNAPKEIALALHIPGAEIAKMDKSVKKTAAQKKHAAHKAKAGHAGKGVMLAEDKFEDMSKCDGKPRGCDELAKNLLKVATDINEECAVLYFQEKEYYACEEKHAGPLCQKVHAQFPNLCSFPKGEIVNHGYIGSESPANIEDEFCQGCRQLQAGGCFASDSQIMVKGKGVMALRAVQLGDEVQSVDEQGAKAWTPVMFLHDHKERSNTLVIDLEDGSRVEMTGKHPVLVSGKRMMPAHQLRARTHSLVSVGADGVARASQVLQVAYGESSVRYIVTGSDRLTVNNVVSAAPSTMIGSIETLPFKTLYVMGLYSKGINKAVSDVLESPFLKKVEDVIDSFAGVPQRPRVGFNLDRLLAAGHGSEI